MSDTTKPAPKSFKTKLDGLPHGFEPYAPVRRKKNFLDYFIGFGPLVGTTLLLLAVIEILLPKVGIDGQRSLLQNSITISFPVYLLSIVAVIQGMKRPRFEVGRARRVRRDEYFTKNLRPWIKKTYGVTLDYKNIEKLYVNRSCIGKDANGNTVLISLQGIEPVYAYVEGESKEFPEYPMMLVDESTHREYIKK